MFLSFIHTTNQHSLHCLNLSFSLNRHGFTSPQCNIRAKNESNFTVLQSNNNGKKFLGSCSHKQQTILQRLLNYKAKIESRGCKETYRQFATVRSILPNLVKQDKASVLGENVRYLNELKKMIQDIPTTPPSLEDNLRLGHCNNNRDMARVVFSCSDREGLMSEVAEAMKAAKAKAVRAEMMTVGGRTKCALFVQGVNGNEGLVKKLKKSLKPVVNGGSLLTQKQQ